MLLPGVSRLARLVGTVRDAANQRLWDTLCGLLNVGQRAVLDSAVARVLADRSYSAQYGRQQVGPQRRQIGQIEGVTDVTTLPPGREQARAAQDSEVAGNLRG